jgi:hypothetical protein
MLNTVNSKNNYFMSTGNNKSIFTQNKPSFKGVCINKTNTKIFKKLDKVQLNTVNSFLDEFEKKIKPKVKNSTPTTYKLFWEVIDEYQIIFSSNINELVNPKNNKPINKTRIAEITEDSFSAVEGMNVLIERDIQILVKQKTHQDRIDNLLNYSTSVFKNKNNLILKVTKPMNFNKISIDQLDVLIECIDLLTTKIPNEAKKNNYMVDVILTCDRTDKLKKIYPNIPDKYQDIKEFVPFLKIKIPKTTTSPEQKIEFIISDLDYYYPEKTIANLKKFFKIA